MLHPENRFKVLWDWIVLVVTASAAVEIPLRLALDIPLRGVFLYFDIFITIVFAIDLVWNFTTPAILNGTLITDKKIIATIASLFTNPLHTEGQQTQHRNELRSLANPQLTPRQCEVLDLLCEGLSNRAIAERMQVSEYTVRGHVQHLLAVLGVNSRSAALYKARKLGLIA